MKRLALLSLIALMSGCSSTTPNEASTTSDPINSAYDDRCDIGAEMVAESERSGYECPVNEGCEWRDLGGKEESVYACCPAKLDAMRLTEEAYNALERCFTRVD